MLNQPVPDLEPSLVPKAIGLQTQRVPDHLRPPRLKIPSGPEQEFDRVRKKDDVPPPAPRLEHGLAIQLVTKTSIQLQQQGSDDLPPPSPIQYKVPPSSPWSPTRYRLLPPTPSQYPLPPSSPSSPTQYELQPLPPIAAISVTTLLRAQQVIPAKEKSEDTEFSHTEYASHKVIPFTSVKQLGYGAVRPAGDEESVLLARKVILLPGMVRKRVLPLIKQEAAILRELSHHHIIKVVCTYETTSVPRQFGILLSPVGEEDLLHYMERVGDNDFPKQDIDNLQKWRCCLASAVAYIHSQNIRHKDIKPNNAICKGDKIFLTDFGSAHQFNDLTSTTEGYAAGVTRMYSAPEVIEEDKRGRSADIFSLGCVFAEMTTVIHGRRLEDFHDFRSEPDPDEPERMTLCCYATAHKLKDWFASDKGPAPYALISSMMVHDQKCRPTAEEVMSAVLGLGLSPMDMVCGCLFGWVVQRPYLIRALFPS